MDRRGFIKLVGAAGVSVPMGSAIAFDDHVLNVIPSSEDVVEPAEFQAEAIAEPIIIDLEQCHRVEYMQNMDEPVSIRADRLVAERVFTTMRRELQVSIESEDTILLAFLQDLHTHGTPVRVRQKFYEIDEPGLITSASITFGLSYCIDLTIQLLGDGHG